MARYSFLYRRNGSHNGHGQTGAIDSGAAFIAAFPNALPEDDSGTIEDSARHVDELAIGDTIRFWMTNGDVDVTRESDDDSGRRVSFIVDLTFHGNDNPSDCLGDEWDNIGDALAAGLEVLSPMSPNFMPGVESISIRVCIETDGESA